MLKEIAKRRDDSELECWANNIEEELQKGEWLYIVAWAEEYKKEFLKKSEDRDKRLKVVKLS